MLQEYLDRLRYLLTTTSDKKEDYENWEKLSEERKQLRAEMEAYKAEKEVNSSRSERPWRAWITPKLSLTALPVDPPASNKP